MTTQTATAIERSDSNTLPAPAHAPQPVATRGEQSTWYYRPSADIFEANDAYTVVLDMPGVAPENLDITYEDQTLIVHGRVNRPEWGREQSRHHRVLRTEYGVGDYFRRFDLGGTIDVDGITAECASGTVRIRLPKVEAARPIKIELAP